MLALQRVMVGVGFAKVLVDVGLAKGTDKWQLCKGYW